MLKIDCENQRVKINLQKTLIFIYMQKFNFISNFFFEILQRHYKLAILKTSGILDRLYQNYSINLDQAFRLICMQKINCITYFFLKMLQRNIKLVILGNMSMPGHTHLK